MSACLLLVNKSADLMLYCFTPVVYLVRLGSVVHVKCGTTVLMRAEHFCRKTAFISNTTRNTRTCLLSRDTQLQTHKRQSNKLVKQWSRNRGTGHTFSHDGASSWVADTCHQHIQTDWGRGNTRRAKNLSSCWNGVRTDTKQPRLQTQDY